MKNIYKGIWLPGSTGWTGSSFIKGRTVTTSKTMVSFPSWIPYLAYMSYGFQLHSKNNDKFNIDKVKKIISMYDIRKSYYDDSGILQYFEEVHNPYDVNKPNDVKYTRLFTVYVRDSENMIGCLQTAYGLTEMGIKDFQPSDEGCQQCAIGWAEKEQKWYGWSHRAIYGFGVGSHVGEGSCGYMPDSKESYIRVLKKFIEYPNHSINENEITFFGKFDINGKPLTYVEELPTSYDGKGEWMATSLSEAKEMAIDFANGVS